MLDSNSKDCAGFHATTITEGVFRASLPPMGFSSYQLQMTLSPGYSQVLKYSPRDVNRDIRIESQVYIYFRNSDIFISKFN